MHTSSWSHTAWQTALPVYEAILQLPFVRELADGTLSRERFNRYIGQDSLYINQYCKILAHIASRSPTSPTPKPSYHSPPTV